jgi:putative colanic acid biosynthesis acetyltransferase WcaF
MDSTAKVYPKASIWAPWNLEMGFDSTLADRVDCYNVDKIIIGNEVTVSQDAMLCTASHDIEDPGRQLVTKPITIGDGAWIFARAFVGPGVTVGKGAIVAACAVVVKDVPEWVVVGGNPSKLLKKRNLRA